MKSSADAPITNAPTTRGPCGFPGCTGYKHESRPCPKFEVSAGLPRRDDDLWRSMLKRIRVSRESLALLNELLASDWSLAIIHGIEQAEHRARSGDPSGSRHALSLRTALHLITRLASLRGKHEDA